MANYYPLQYLYRDQNGIPRGGPPPKPAQPKFVEIRPLMKHLTKRFKWKAQEAEEEEEYFEESLTGSATEAKEAPKTKVVAPVGMVAYYSGYTSDPFCWGKGLELQLGNGKALAFSQPTRVSSLADRAIRMTACAKSATVCLTTTGDVFSFGTGFVTGHGSAGAVRIPKRIDAIAGVNIRKIACGEGFCIALTDMGKVCAWGIGEEGQTGLGGSQIYAEPTFNPHTMAINIVDIAAGSHFSLLLAESGNLYSSGRNTDGQLGIGGNTSAMKPTLIRALFGKKVIQFSAGSDHAAAVTDAGLFTWGNGKYGKLGHGNKNTMRAPRLVESIEGKVSEVSCGFDHTLFINGDGRVLGFGANQWKQVNPSHQEALYKPTLVPLDTACIAIYAGTKNSIAITKHHEAYEWGLTQNETEPFAPSPRAIPSLYKQVVYSVSTGSGHSAAVVSKKTQVANDLTTLLSSAKFSDISLVLDGNVIVPTHKFILYARSPFFKELFGTDEGAKMEAFGVPAVDRPTVIALLEYLYTDYIAQLDTRLAEKLEPLAIKFQLKRLEAICKAEVEFAKTKTMQWVPAPRLEEDFQAMINSPALADSNILIEETQQTLKAHRLMLYTRAPYFKSMMDSGMQESEKGGVIPITDSNVEVFKSILQYLYTGSTLLPPDAIIELLLVSRRYQLVGLTQQCERFVVENMVFENVLDVFDLATTIESYVLQNACKKLVLDRYSEVKALPDYAEYGQGHKDQFEAWWEAKQAETVVQPKERSDNMWNKFLDEAKSDIYQTQGTVKKGDNAAKTSSASYEFDEDYDEVQAQYVYKRPGSGNKAAEDDDEDDYDDDDY